MTGHTRSVVISRERKIVREAGRIPSGDGVAYSAILREAESNMIRGRLIVRAMAGITIRWRALVNPTGMALRTTEPGMPARQREERMIHHGRRPPID